MRVHGTDGAHRRDGRGDVVEDEDAVGEAVDRVNDVAGVVQRQPGGEAERRADAVGVNEAATLVELEDPLLAEVGRVLRHVDVVVAGVDGHLGGGAGEHVGGEDGVERARRVEPLHAGVAQLDDVDGAGGVGGDGDGSSELAVARAGGAELADVGTRGVEALYPVVAVVGHVDVPAQRVHGDALGGAELAVARPRGAELQDVVAGGVELLHAGVADVDHVDRAVRLVDRDPLGSAQLAVAGTGGAELADEDAVRVEALDAVAAGVDHVDVAAGVVDRHLASGLELTVLVSEAAEDRRHRLAGERTGETDRQRGPQHGQHRRHGLGVPRAPTPRLRRQLRHSSLPLPSRLTRSSDRPCQPLLQMRSRYYISVSQICDPGNIDGCISGVKPVYVPSLSSVSRVFR